MSKHYTAVIEIKQVENPATSRSTDKEVTEVTRVVVRADTLAKLVLKAGSHLALIEE